MFRQSHRNEIILSSWRLRTKRTGAHQKCGKKKGEREREMATQIFQRKSLGASGKFIFIFLGGYQGVETDSINTTHKKKHRHSNLLTQF